MSVAEHPDDTPTTHLRALPDTPTQDTNPDAERAVLGAILLAGRTALDQATLHIQAGDYASTPHQRIHEAAEHLYTRNLPVDTITVADQLGPKALRKAGGLSYLTELANHGIGVIDVTYHAQIVAEHAQARRYRTHLYAAIQRLEQRGHTPLQELVDHDLQAITKLPTGVPGVEHGPQTSWAPINLENHLNGTHTPPRASILTRQDGKPLLYPYAIHSIAGEPGSGKTWIAHAAATQQLALNHAVAFIDFEDRADTAIARLRALGATVEQLRDHFRYIRPDDPLNALASRELDTATHDCSLVIIDGITEAMTLHGLSLMDNEDVARWLALIPRRIADHGPAVLQIDHVTKDTDTRGRYAIGGQHKLAGITGVQYKLVTFKSMGKGVKGHAKLVIDKDKHGDVGPNGATVADFHLDASGPSGTIFGWLEEPGSTTDPGDGHFRPTTLMSRVSGFLQMQPGASLNEIKAGVKGKNESKADAVQALILEGHIRTETGPRGTTHHHLQKPFMEGPR